MLDEEKKFKNMAILFYIDIGISYIYKLLYIIVIDMWVMAWGYGYSMSAIISVVAVSIMLNFLNSVNLVTIASIAGSTILWGWKYGFCGGILVFIVIPFIWHIIMIWLFSMQLGDREQKDEDNLG